MKIAKSMSCQIVTLMLALLGMPAGAQEAAREVRRHPAFTIIDLGTLPEATLVVSEATAINDRGQIVGYAETPSGDRHAVLWNPARHR